MKHRYHIPQDGGLFLTAGGIETTLIFHEGRDLPLFAAFDLLKDDEGTQALRRYFEPYAELAREHGLGVMLEGQVAAGPLRSAVQSRSSTSSTGRESP